ncbi:MAG: hypothetical protein ACE5QF_08495 [Thermoplasmata archaeon]
MLLRVTILFALSAILVSGFWFHAEFYKFGLPVLVIAGTVMVIVIILAFRFAISGRLQPIGRPKKTLEFDLADLDKVRHGVKESILRKPQDNREIKPGTIVSARLKGTNSEICRLRIVGIDRKYLADLDRKDLDGLGIASKGEFSSMWRRTGGSLNERVFGELVFFEPLEAETRE